MQQLAFFLDSVKIHVSWPVTTACGDQALLCDVGFAVDFVIG